MTPLLPPLTLGRLTVAPAVVLAPMAGITDWAFRLLCAEFGGGLYVSEMVTARGLVEGNARSHGYVSFHPDEPQRSLQLYGSDPAVMRTAVAELVDRDRVDHIDLNVGCPVPKVMRTGGGAALPVKRRLFAAVVAAAVEAAGDVPVTVKMRMGLDDERLTYLDAGRIAADAGAVAVALHGRTAAQGYSGEADWDAITALKAALPDTPVLGNGDIWTAADAVAMVERTGCDGVVIGRGCLGRPWLFRDLELVFRGEDALGPPAFGALVPTIERHLHLLLQRYEGDPEVAILRRFRKHLRWYVEGYDLPDELLRDAARIEHAGDVATFLDRCEPTARMRPEDLRRPRGKTRVGGRVRVPEGWWDDRDADAHVEDPLGALSGG